MAVRKRKKGPPPKRRDVPKQDLFRECNEFGVNPEEFLQTFCRRCRNHTCVNAGWADSQWEQRMLTQVERLLTNPIFADPDDPRYSMISTQEFPSILREAIRLNQIEAEWANPGKTSNRIEEIQYADLPVRELDPDSDQQVDDAIEKLTGKRSVPEPEPEPVSAVVVDPEEKLTAPPPVLSPDIQVPRGFIPPPTYNAPAQSGYVEGGEATASVSHDSWAIPKKPDNLVDVGSTVKMGKKK